MRFGQNIRVKTVAGCVSCNALPMNHVSYLERKFRKFRKLRKLKSKKLILARHELICSAENRGMKALQRLFSVQIFSRHNPISKMLLKICAICEIC